MASTAVQLGARFEAGWNAGNTLEAIGGETAWGIELSNSLMNSMPNDTVGDPVALDAVMRGVRGMP